MCPAFTPHPSGGFAPPLPTGLSGPAGTGRVAARACGGCGRGIQDRYLLHAVERYWHVGCLKCTCCQAQLGQIGRSCFTRAGMILCRDDYVRLFGSGGSCAGCGQKIAASELVLRTQTGSHSQACVYHIRCFVCVTCRQPLQPGDRYSVVNGTIVCESDCPKTIIKGQGRAQGHGQSQCQGHVPLPSRTPHKVC